MKQFSTFLAVFCSTILLSCCQGQQQDSPLQPLSVEIEPNDIKTHITFLASDSLRGRETGTRGEAIAANYIADFFQKYDLQPLGNGGTYFQPFTVNMDNVRNPHGASSSRDSGDVRLSRNVVGMIEGREHPDTYIIIGAHYDHLGEGTFGSLANRRRNQIHNGADDNASGTAGILELAQYFSNHPPQKSLVFTAFSGEEIGLLGSQYFVENSLVPLIQIQAMINLDMVGRLQDNKLLIFGTGSSTAWEQIIANVNTDSLNINSIPDGTGASDHTSFYNRQIPVLHYFTDTHADYHRPSDDAEYINYEGEDLVLEHTKRLLQELDTLAGDQLVFTEVPENEQQRDMMIKGVTLGVTPDYGFEGTGMRITGTSSGGPAHSAGLQNGDVIIALDGQPTEDIYEYMEVLNTLEEGQKSTVTVKRDKKELTLEIQF
ncbi:M28 family peptidase [Aliifodinibius sp. S!AR15-10]|uniref:M28 family peptidase n=1 Tax=Aliifodinibius sp. S!AR15-10 TaxID=2950437 RepID=UPI0028544BC3|nr:M28 family peptidase [Aliifodinibius sp. S!AR15-10]MDR8392882.1 M28 family peptidase [Aliifodinibius sp. S!AR15-10]